MRDPADPPRPAIVASGDRLDLAGQVAEVADLFEIRLDLGGAGVDDVLAYDGPLPLIVTNRARTPSAAVNGPAKLERALEGDAVWAIDLDLARWSDADTLVDRAGQLDTNIICSSHPSNADALASLADRVLGRGDIGKLAVECADAAAFAALVETTVATSQRSEPLAAMATGRFGPPSRLLGIALEVPLVYGSVPGREPTAPGQVSVDRLGAVREGLRLDHAISAR